MSNISELAFVSPEAKIGENCTIHPFAYIDKNVVIGDNNEIMPYASIMSGARIGNNNRFFQGCVIAAEPQDFNYQGEDTCAYIGDNNVFREYSVVIRATHSTGATRVGNHNFIMQAARLSHDVTVKDYCLIGNGSQVSGGCLLEGHCILCSNVLMQGNTRLGVWSVVQGGCRFTKDVPPFIIAAHDPTSFYTINKPVLDYKGFSPTVIKHIAHAYRLIYKANTSIGDALDRVEQEVPMSDEIQQIVDFIRNSKLGII